MSHVVEIKTEIRDEQAIRAACVRLQLATSEQKTVRLLNATATGEGATSIKTTGFTGSSCKDATRDIERALGVSGRESLLPEYFNRTSTGQKLRQGT